MSAQDIIDQAKLIRQRLRNPPNAVYDPGIDLTRKSTAHKGSEPNPDPAPKKALVEPIIVEPSYPPMDIRFPITFDDIVEAVAIHYGLTTGAIKGPSRKAHKVFARYVAIYLSRRLIPTRSLASIGRDLGKDHSTILAARDRFNGILAGNSRVAAEVQMIEVYIEAAYNNRPSLASQSELYLERIGQTGLPESGIYQLDSPGPR